MITTILFDLDGTLLPMDQEVFTKKYFKLLAMKLAPYGYDPDALIKGIWDGMWAMANNTGEITNEKAFWDCFLGIFGEQAMEHLEVFEAFYQNEFNQAQDTTSRNPEARTAVDTLKEMGCHLVLATNPIFPRTATYNRIDWAGFAPEEFELITTYENSTSCKPNLNYYREILEKLNRQPQECLMVGNDASEDMCASELGMSVFLLKDCLLNHYNKDISPYPQGSFKELVEYVREQRMQNV